MGFCMATDKVLYKLTNAQRQVVDPMFVLPKKSGEQAELSVYFEVKSNADINALERAFNYLIQDNDGLRVRIILTLQGMRQYIADYDYETIPVFDVASEEEKLQIIREHRALGHGVFNDKLYHALIIRNGDAAMLYMTLQHSIFDGYSINLWLKSIKEYYECCINNEEPHIGEKKYCYEKYIQYDTKLRENKKIKANNKYFANLLNKTKAYNVVVPIKKGYAPSAHREFAFDDNEYQIIKSAAEKIGVPVSGYVSSVIALVFSINSKVNHLALTHLSHGRMTAAQRQTIGSMTQLVLSPYHVNGDELFAEYVANSFSAYLEGLKHLESDVISILVRAIPRELLTMRVNHWGFLLSFMNYGDETLDKDKYEFGTVPWTHQANQYYCTVSDNGTDKLRFSIDYQTKVIREERLDQIMDMLKRAMVVCAKHSDYTVRQLCSDLEN